MQWHNQIWLYKAQRQYLNNQVDNSHLHCGGDNALPNNGNFCERCRSSIPSFQAITRSVPKRLAH